MEWRGKMSERKKQRKGDKIKREETSCYKKYMSILQHKRCQLKE